MLKFLRKKVGEQGKRNKKEGKREERKEGRDVKERRGSGRERKSYLFGHGKEGDTMQKETSA